MSWTRWLNHRHAADYTGRGYAARLNGWWRALAGHPVLTGGMWFYAASIVAGILNYLFNILMARDAFLGPSGFGALASLLALIQLGGVVTSTLTTVTTRYTATYLAKQQPELVGRLLAALLRGVGLWSFLMVLIIAAATPLLTRFLNLSSSWLVLTLAPVLALMFLQGVTSGVVQGTAAFRLLALLTVLAAILRLLFAAGLVRAGAGIVGAILSSAAAGAFALAFSLYFLWRYLRLGKAAASPAVEKLDFLRHSSPVFLALVGLTVLSSLHLVLAKHYLGPESAGIYSGLATLGSVAFFGTLPFTVIMFPLLARRVVQRRPVHGVLLASGGLVLGGAALVVALYYVVPRFIIHWTIGDSYLVRSASLWLFAMFFALASVATWLVYVFLALRDALIVLYPLAFAFLQAVLVTRYHSSVEAIILVVLLNELLLGLALVLAGYGRFSTSRGRAAVIV